MIIVGAIVGYATMRADNDTTRTKLDDHILAQSSYVRKDVQDTRNNFIDKELANIEKRLDNIDKTQQDILKEIKLLR